MKILAKLALAAHTSSFFNTLSHSIFSFKALDNLINPIIVEDDESLKDFYPDGDDDMPPGILIKSKLATEINPVLEGKIGRTETELADIVEVQIAPKKEKHVSFASETDDPSVSAIPASSTDEESLRLLDQSLFSAATESEDLECTSDEAETFDCLSALPENDATSRFAGSYDDSSAGSSDAGTALSCGLHYL